MRGPDRGRTGHGDAFPEGKVRRRLDQLSELRGLTVEDIAPDRPETASSTVAFAAGLLAAGARLGHVTLPDVPADADGADTVTAALSATEGITVPEELDAGAVTDVRTEADEDAPGEVAPDENEDEPLAGIVGLDATAFTPPLAPWWRTVGPSYMPNGQTYGSGGNNRVDVAGRVSAVAVDPGDRDHLLVGAAGGGIWESRDRGASWWPRSDAMPSLATGALAFDPSNPSIVYAGTGEGDFYRALGAGVLRSTNGGASWSVRATAPFVGVGFQDLCVDPADPARLLAATRNGIHESQDAGLTWTQRLGGVAWTISRGAGELLAATSGGVVSSTDGGTTWDAVALPSPPGSWTRLAVRHAPSDPDVAWVFASGDGAAWLWRRSVAGGAWSRVGVPSGVAVNQSWYDWFLGVSPANPDLVFLGAIDVWRGVRFRGRYFWSNITARASGDSIHPDQHAIAFDPVDPAVVYVGNDGGLFRSPDHGGTWQALNRGLYITEIEYLAQDLGDCRFLFGGTQDNGSTRFTGSHVWEHAQDGDGGDCGVVDDAPSVVYHSFYGMGFERSTTGGGWGSWSWRGPNVPAGYGALFYPPLDASFSTVAQAGQSIFLSRDRGDSFTEMDLPGPGVATAMHAASADVVYAGMSDGRVARASWSGGSWSVTELSSPRSGTAVSDLHLSPSGSRLFATYRALGGGRVFLSTDGGSSWSDVTSNLPQVAVNAVVVDPGNASRVWVGCDVGVYQSLDTGGTWQQLAPGLPNCLVGDLLFHPDARLLRAGTRNRGVWEVDVDGVLQSPICGVQWQGTLGPRQRARWFTFNWPSTWHVLWTVMPTTPRSGAPQLSWNVEVERGDSRRTTYWITVSNLVDDPVSFEGRYAILSRC